MDLWSLHLSNVNHTPLLLNKYCFPRKSPVSLDLGKIGQVFFVRIPRQNKESFSYDGYRSVCVRAMGKKNHENPSSSGSDDPSVPEDDIKGNNPPFDSNKSNETDFQKCHRITLDWREFRASLFAHEQEEKAAPDVDNKDEVSQKSIPLGLKWAHPISVPETGCILVATEKLDGVRTFERSVVFLLRSGTRHPQEGPFGIVISRPLHKKMKHMKPTNLDLATTFTDCPLYFGGPLESCMFLLKTTGQEKTTQLPLFEEVMPGLYFGARNSLDEAARLVKNGVLKPQDFRFFVGYAGWQVDQLREEIESGYWHVASCSSNLIHGDATEGLWEEILQLMGGRYSKLSRKPKQDM